MAETDYVFVKPLMFDQLPSLGHSVGFHFGYVAPAYKGHAELTRKFLGSDVNPEDVPQTGNAPQLMHTSDLAKVLPLWVDMHARVEADAESVAAFGWVRDMYSYSFAAHKSGVRHHVALVPFNTLMVQIPADVTLGDAAIVHYTWGPRISVNGTVVWSFDKREYVPPLHHLPIPPPWNPWMRLQANETVTQEGLGLIKLFVNVFNECVTFVKASTFFK